MDKKFYEEFPNKLKLARIEQELIIFLNSFTLSPN